MGGFGNRSALKPAAAAASALDALDPHFEHSYQDPFVVMLEQVA